MRFNSYGFILVFFPVTLAGYWLLPARFRQGWLLLAGLAFYADAGLGFLALLLGMMGITYAAAIVNTRAVTLRGKRWALLLALSNLLALGVFKYSGFLAATLTGSALDVALPFGISYYTFNLLGYSLDVHNRRIPAETNLLRFANYATFFPTIGSGPLLRYKPFHEQNAGTQRAAPLPEVTRFDTGLFYFVLGLAKKLIIADSIGAVIDPLFADYAHLQLWSAWVAVIGYTYQLYFDFSGYTDMAIGIGLCLGFNLPQNFNAPYAARNITEFWQRWHMSLSNWFRDYLFFPLSRALLVRDNRQHPDRIRTISLMITMTLTGLWHGANWTFIVWGAYHGVMLAAHAQARANKWRELPEPLARALTFILVTMGWAVFRSTSLDMALGIYRAMFGANGVESSLYAVAGMTDEFLWMVVMLFAITNIGKDTANLRPQRGWMFAATLSVLVVICLLFLDQTSPFLYVQF